MSTLEKAIALAAEAHEGQLDKAGAPYILHPLRVMLRMQAPDDRIAAILHDVVEDTDWTLEALRTAGFSQSVVNAVDALTHREDESYEEAIARAGADPIARRVKLGDLADNSDLARIANPTERDHQRLQKYQRAIAILQ